MDVNERLQRRVDRYNRATAFGVELKKRLVAALQEKGITKLRNGSRSPVPKRVKQVFEGLASDLPEDVRAWLVPYSGALVLTVDCHGERNELQIATVDDRGKVTRFASEQRPRFYSATDVQRVRDRIQWLQRELAEAKSALGPFGMFDPSW